METQDEIKNLVDQLEEDNPMDENADLGDDQEAIEDSFENDNPMNDDTEAEDFLDAVVDDNPMHEDSEDLGDGVEIAKEEIGNHDEVGEPRNSEEVKELVDALDSDNPM